MVFCCCVGKILPVRVTVMPSDRFGSVAFYCRKRRTVGGSFVSKRRLLIICVSGTGIVGVS